MTSIGYYGIVVLFAILQYVAAQDPNCDYASNIQAGLTYYIYSRGYPRNYTGPLQCRWIVTAPTGYRNNLQCDINLPSSPGCSLDRLMISRSGDPQLSSPDVFCGRGSTSILSNGPRMSIGLIAARTSPGGRFYCELNAVPSQTTPPSCSCGYKKRSRIVGGQETGINEFPMMAGVVDVRITEIKCGGTIIDKRYVLTAAHCVAGMALSNLGVVVGEHDVNAGETDATQAYAVVRITIHPQYNPSNYDYDTAILRVAQDMTFSERVGPACLPFKFVNNDFSGATVTLLGWGTLYTGGPKPGTLQKVDVQVISQSSCRRTNPSLTDRQMCTYTAGKDACQDDSGGPVLYQDDATGLLFGVGTISYGRFCAQRDQPGINTRTTSVLNWIQSSTPDAVYCIK